MHPLIDMLLKASYYQFVVVHSNIVRCTLTHILESSCGQYVDINLCFMFYDLLIGVVCRSGTHCYHTAALTEPVDMCLSITITSYNLEFYNSSSLLKTKSLYSAITVLV